VQQETKRDASRKHFDRWAPKYETDRVSRCLQEAQSEALAALELRPDDSLLDIGCGTGAAVRDAAAYVDRAVGFDLSPAMVARARTLADGLDNVQFYGGDASERLPFGDGEFTAIVCTTAFHHFPDPAESVREMERVLAPGGRVVIADANAEQRRADPRLHASPLPAKPCRVLPTGAARAAAHERRPSRSDRRDPLEGRVRGRPRRQARQ
jgi:ubiquinone/menaquinone biosynthesis C-methylase UbiE